MKYLISILILILTKMDIVGQTIYPYPQPGLIQGEIYHGDWTSPGLFDESIKYIKDTIISSLNYSYFTNQKFQNYYTRYDNGKIYRCNYFSGGVCQNEMLQYDFSLGISDTFPAGDWGNIAVDSISTITLLNGQERKLLVLKGVDGWNNDRIFKWVDGIGDIERGFLYSVGFEGSYTEFVCHRDSSGVAYVKTPIKWDCDSLSGYMPVGKKKEFKNEVFLEENQPNPFNSITVIPYRIKNNSPASIRIMDYTGRIIRKIDLNNEENQIILKMEEFTNGIYWYSLVLEGTVFKTRSMIISR